MKKNPTEDPRRSRDGVLRQIVKLFMKSKFNAPADGQVQRLRRGRITRNPFLNFMRDVRKSIRGVSPLELSVKGAIIWRSMSQHEKEPYQQMARQARKIIRRPRIRRQESDDFERSERRAREYHTEAKRRGSRRRRKRRRRSRSRIHRRH
ncbi:unnamed protein product [Ceutorhynchus assimilis]|uniref:HMG box domain-containing protein n=1 Tax=Ceutorhynchus assimilis TaxID=467358 RepID=A0A9N9QQR6_9CUCU|nr:unnamed protein product [Ceutorhynchus assimilis]